MAAINETYRTPLHFSVSTDDIEDMRNRETETTEADAENDGIQVEIERPVAGQYVDPGEPEDDANARFQALRQERDAAYQVANAERALRGQYDEAIAIARHRDVVAGAWHEEYQNLQRARDSLTAADEAFDSRGKAAAIEEIALRTAGLEHLRAAYQNLDERAKIPQPQQQPQQTDRFEAAISNYSEPDKEWLRRHREDLEHDQQRVQKLEATANYATAGLGLTSGTDEFYAFLNDQMGYSDAEQPTPRRQSRQQSGMSKRMVAAPSSRSSGRSPAGRVHLSEFDMKTAKDLGLSYEDYAKKYKARATEGQPSREQAGGRLWSSYSSQDQW
jgi:hypothetical protein